MDTTRIEETAVKVQEQLERVKAARPALKSRCERAEGIVVGQLSLPNGQRPIKVRMHADGSFEYRVRSGSKLKREYAVDPSNNFACECPDAQKRGAACKHGIAAFVLARASA